MAYTSYPFDNQDTTESQYSALFRELQDSGVVGGYGSTELQVGANASAMSVTLQPGSAIVRGHYFTNDAVATLTIGPAGTGVRYDAVVLQLNPTSNTITPVVKANAGATPALTQTTTGIFEILLAVVTVPANAVTIAAGDVADRRPWVRHRIGVWTTSTRPANPRPFEIGFNVTTGYLERYDGTGWVSPKIAYVDELTAINGPQRALHIHHGTFTAFPITNLKPGDTCTRTDLNNTVFQYTGTAWRRVAPPTLIASSQSLNNGAVLGPGATGLNLTAQVSIPAHAPGTLHISGHVFMNAASVVAGYVQAFVGPTSSTMVAVGDRSRFHNNGLSNWTVPADGYIQTDGSAKVAGFVGWSDSGSSGNSNTSVSSIRVYLL